MAIISQSFAKTYFHGKDPIGLHMKVGDRFEGPMPAITVVGVVGDVKQGALDQPTVEQMYEPVSQAAAALGPMAAMLGVAGNMDVVITHGRRSNAAGAEPGEKLSMNSTRCWCCRRCIRWMRLWRQHESSRRFNTVILTAFAAIALSLSLLGIYGVLAYAVAQRTREIAIRMALGASRKVVLLRTLRYALTVAVTGVAGGLVASVGLDALS